MGISVLFGIHCHQPVDNFSYIVDEVIEKSYLPFIEHASKYPEFRFAVHYSGWLLEYIRRHSPVLFNLLKDLSDTGQVEFFSGGFYEPILSSIPKKDRIGQITLLNDYIYNHFGQKPKGLWLTERVWDPSIVPDLVECGIEYVIVDDYHFIATGFLKKDLYGYYLTEQDGLSLKVFPIDQKLRYIVPFKEPEEIEEYLLSAINIGARGAILFDDGEKFGMWPKTYEWVYTNGWIERFFNKILNNQNITFTHFGEFANTEKPLGLAYLPMVSYMEMGEWSLFPEMFVSLEKLIGYLKTTDFASNIEQFVKGAHWKNFLVKYPESNHLHKRVLSLSRRLEHVRDKDIIDLLYRSECNDVFWHGIFGGIYLPNLRDNAYRYIINAEYLTDRLENSISSNYYFDLLLDGFGCYTLKNDHLSTIFSLKNGGQLISFDIRKNGMNLLNTLSRKKEGYHDQLFRSDNEKTGQNSSGITTIHEMDIRLTDEVKSEIAFDWYHRYSFVDHFVTAIEPDMLKNTTYNELGNFVNQPFEGNLDGNTLILHKKGGIFSDLSYAATVQKCFKLEDNNLSFSYDIASECPFDLLHLLELNFHFYDYESLLINGKKLQPVLELFSSAVKISFESYNLDLSIGINVNPIIYPIKTVHQSEQGADFTIQGISIIFPIKFNKNTHFEGTLSIEGVGDACKI